MEDYRKYFDGWNERKKILDNLSVMAYPYPRELWWCSLGVNIGAETDGKNEEFERPVLVIRVYNKETMLILPVTSTVKNDIFHCPITVKEGKQWVKLTQARVVSVKRMLRKITFISDQDFGRVRKKLQFYL